MPFVECVPVLDFTPKEENLLSLKKCFVLLRDRPSDIDVKSNITKRDAWDAALALGHGEIIKRYLVDGVDLGVRLYSQIVGRSLTVIPQFSMGNERNPPCSKG